MFPKTSRNLLCKIHLWRGETRRETLHNLEEEPGHNLDKSTLQGRVAMELRPL